MLSHNASFWGKRLVPPCLDSCLGQNKGLFTLIARQTRNLYYIDTRLKTNANHGKRQSKKCISLIVFKRKKPCFTENVNSDFSVIFFFKNFQELELILLHTFTYNMTWNQWSLSCIFYPISCSITLTITFSIWNHRLSFFAVLLVWDVSGMHENRQKLWKWLGVCFILYLELLELKGRWKLAM